MVVDSIIYTNENLATSFANNNIQTLLYFICFCYPTFIINQDLSFAHFLIPPHTPCMYKDDDRYLTFSVLHYTCLYDVQDHYDDNDLVHRLLLVSISFFPFQ